MCAITGRSRTGTIGLVISLVRGRRRGARPAARTIALMGSATYRKRKQREAASMPGREELSKLYARKAPPYPDRKSSFWYLIFSYAFAQRGCLREHSNEVRAPAAFTGAGAFRAARLRGLYAPCSQELRYTRWSSRNS